VFEYKIGFINDLNPVNAINPAKNGAAKLVPPIPYAKFPLKYNCIPVFGSELNAISGEFLFVPGIKD